MDILARILNPFLMVAMPLALGVYLARRVKAEWHLFGIGMVTFIASQIVHIPFNARVLAPAMQSYDLAAATEGFPLIVAAILLGLSAGVFEETARFLVYRFWIRDARTWKDALMFGAGHGGIEAIIIGAIVVYGLLQAITLRDANLSLIVPADSVEIAQAQLDVYWSAPWHAAILGAVERAGSILFHLGASVLVLQALTRKNILWLGLAIGWHTLMDAVAVYGSRTWNIYVLEGLILLAGLLSIVLIIKLKPPDEPEDTLSPPSPLPQIVIKPPEPSLDDLENSRYT